MLDNISENLRTWGLGLLVGTLCVIFILQFGGPQAQGCTQGGANTFGAKVYGETITPAEFEGTYRLAGFDGYSRDMAQQMGLKELAMNGLVERELLAREAEKLGLKVKADEVWGRLIDDSEVLVSVSVDAPAAMRGGVRPLDVRDRDGDLDLERAKNMIQFGLRRSIQEFEESQQREQQAERMREILLSTIIVSPREVWDAFVRERESVTVKYVRFAPAYYRRTLTPTDDEVRAWMTDNTAAVDEAYTARRHRYTGLEKQVRSRHILIRVEEGASDEVKAAARARAEALLARARAGEDFATLARENSEEPETAVLGGDLGYNVRGRKPAAFDEAQFALEAGGISDVVETRFGFHVIKVEGIREGDVPEDEAKLEIAHELYREHRAETLAQEAAQRAQASVQGGASMDDLEAQLRGTPAPAEGQEAPEDPRGDDPTAPRVQTSRPFGRADSPIPGLPAGPVLTAAWALTTEAPMPAAPIEAGNEWLVMRLERRETAERADFDEATQRRLTDGLIRLKEAEAVSLFIHRLRERADTEGEVRVNEDLISYGTRRGRDQAEGEEGEGESEEGEAERPRESEDEPEARPGRPSPGSEERPSGATQKKQGEEE